MMQWDRRGLVYGPDGTSAWARHSALQPTPVLLDDETIRVFVGFRDDTGVSRVGFVDVCAGEPGRVLRVSDEPVLDIGVAGAFDDHGVVPTSVIRRDGRWYLYFAGYQAVTRVKFLAFTGLATAAEPGGVFERIQRVPVTDRTDDELYFRVIHSLVFDGDVWRVWYGGGSGFEERNGRQYPLYDIRYMESPDGVTFPRRGQVVEGLKAADEYRVGRPCVIRDGGLYRMFYSRASFDRPYRMAYAESRDGRTWSANHDEVGFPPSPAGWDSAMIAFPGVIQWRDSVYLFYNGNDYGRDGFGYAVLRQW